METTQPLPLLDCAKSENVLIDNLNLLYQLVPIVFFLPCITAKSLASDILYMKFMYKISHCIKYSKVFEIQAETLYFSLWKNSKEVSYLLCPLSFKRLPLDFVVSLTSKNTLKTSAKVFQERETEKCQISEDKFAWLKYSTSLI